MKRALTSMAAATGALMVSGAGCAAIAPASGVTAYTNARWFDGAAFQQGTRYVREGRFTARPLGRPERTVDLGGGYVVPPYGDAHNHIPDVARSPAFVRAGVFYAKNPNALHSATTGLRAFYARPGGVDATLAMGGITGPGGHPVPLYTETLRKYVYTKMSAEQMYGDAFHIAADPAGVEPAMAALAEHRPDFVKTYLLHSEEYAARKNDPKKSKGLDPALLPAVVKAAHARGLKVAIHVETAADFRAALAAGVDEVAHMPGYSSGSIPTAPYRLTAADAQAAARRGVAVVTTTAIGEAGAEDPARKAQIVGLQRENLRVLKAAGAPILIGSDSGPAAALQEAKHLAALGVFTRTEVVRKLSMETPRAIFPKRRVGGLRPGYEASFLVLSGDPTRDLSALEAVSRWFMEGEELKPPAPAN
jgi:imidazolonepropionase-like amidohydrolase